MDTYGSDQFWKFVDDINWASRPSEKKASYSKEELTQFENESRYLSGLISDYIYEHNPCYIRNTGKCSGVF